MHPKRHHFALAVLVLAGLSCKPPVPPTGAIFHPSGVRALHPADIQAGALALQEQTYIPVYSNIFWGEPDVVTELSVVVSIRNVDAHVPLILTTVDYYGSQGNLIRKYLDAPQRLDPMGTVELVIERRDTEGGAGANFLVDWGAESAIAEPVMESIMLGQIGTSGISFLSPGRRVTVLQPAQPFR
jgi:hypothetical protein